MKEKIQVIETQEEDDMVDFLAKLEQVATKKPARRFSTIQRDEAGYRTVQIVVEKLDEAKGDIASHEYEITTLNLGPTTKKQEAEDLDNSIASMKARLDKEIGKKEYKREVEHLRDYIQHLTKQLDQANPEAPPLLTSQETT